MVALISTNSFISEVSAQGITLNQQQLRSLPNRVQESARDTFVSLQADPRIQKITPRSNKPLALRLDGGRLYLTPVGEKSRFANSVRALDHPAVLRTMSQLQSAARTHMPSSTPFAYPVTETRSNTAGDYFGLETSEVAGDVNGFVGHSLELAGRGAKVLPAISSLGGHLHVFGAIQKVRKHTTAGLTARSCSDREGIVKASFLGGASGIGLLGSASKAAFGTTMSWCSLGANAMLSSSAMHSLWYLPSFRKEFNQIIDRQDISLQKKGELSILFLQQQIALTEEDQRVIALEHPSLEKRTAATQRKLEEKWDRFVRRVGSACANKIATHSNEMLEEVRNGQLDGVLSLWRLISHNISSRITTQLIILGLSLLGAALSLVGILAGTSLSSTVVFAMSALGAMSAILWLLVDSSYVRKKILLE